MKKKNQYQLIAIVLVVVLAGTALFIWLSQPKESDIDISSMLPPASIPRGQTADGYYYLGQQDAPLEVVIYEDYGCKACANFKKKYEKSFLEDYVATGDVKLIIKPVAIVDNQISFSALEALYCAESYGNYWEYRHSLFYNLDHGLNQSRYIALAVIFGIDKNEFIECLTGTQYSDLINEQNEAAWDAGVQNSPTFLIGGELYSGLVYEYPEETEEVSLVDVLNEYLNK